MNRRKSVYAGSTDNVERQNVMAISNSSVVPAYTLNGVAAKKKVLRVPGVVCRRGGDCGVGKQISRGKQMQFSG